MLHSPPRSASLVATLGLLTAVAPLGIDMFIPGLPDVARDLGVPGGVAGLAVSAFLLGLMAGQLVIGPVSDQRGRRRLLIAGSAANAVFCLVCAVAPTATVLIGARVLAAFCGAAGIVLARAVITDLYSGPRLTRYIAYSGLVNGVAPIVAPAIGGLLLQVTSWRAVFVVLAVFAAISTLLAVRFVPESLPPERRRSGGVRDVLGSFATLLRRRALLGWVLGFAGVSAAMFTYIADSSFVFQDHYGVSTLGYSLVFASIAVGMLAAGVLVGAVANRLGSPTIASIGLGTALLGAALHVVGLVTLGESVALTWSSLAVTMVGIGMVFPSATAISQTLGADAPGAASALLGVSQFLVGALASPIAGLISPADPHALALVVLVGMVVAVLAVVLVARPRLRPSLPSGA